VFSSCSTNYDVVFKITNKLKVNNYKFNGDFKSYITVRRTLEKQLAFSFSFRLKE
jgi:glutathione peroxidase-family protein